MRTHLEASRRFIGRPCRGIRGYGAILSVLLLGSFARAQSEPQQLANASLEQLMQVQVYSASKYLQDATDAPSSVSVVTAQDIQRYGYRTLAEVLRSVRGFYVTYDRNYSYSGVRGFARPGDYNTRILLLINGHRFNDDIYDDAPLGTEFPLDLDLVERVEIIRGPASSLYGTSAFFAVINVVTKTPLTPRRLELSTEAGAFGSYKGRITGSGSIGGLGGLVSASFYNSRGQDLYFPEFDTPTTNHGVALNADDDAFHQLFTRVRWRQLTLEALYGNREKGIPTASFGSVFNDPRTRTKDQRAYLDMQYTTALGSKSELSGRTSYDHYRYSGVYVSAGESNARTLNMDGALGTWWSGELKISTTKLRRQHLTAGGELRDNLRQNQFNYDLDPFTLYLADQRSSWVGAVYVQDEFTIRKDLSLSAGVRRDHYSTYGSNTSPRLGLIYSPWMQTRVKLLFGRAFRAPNVFELYYGVGSYVRNPELHAETIQTSELVLEQMAGKHLRIAASAFSNRITGLISLTVDPDANLVFRNLDRVRASGVEGELEARLPSGIEAQAAYTFTETERDTQDNLTNSPKHVVKLNASLPLLSRRLFASADAQYTSARLALRGGRVGGFPLFNFTLLTRDVSSRVDVSATLYNAFNRAYADPGGDEHVQTALRQDGRGFRLKLTYRFGHPQ